MLLHVAGHVRPVAVDVGEAVLLRERARTVDAAALPLHLRVRRQRGDRAADEARRLGRDEAPLLRLGIVLGRLAPVRFGDAEPLEDRLGAHEPRRDRQRRHAFRRQLLRHPVRQALQRDLHQVEEELPVIADAVLLDDLHHQARLARDHQRRRVPAGDDVGPEPAVEEGAAFVERQLPEALPRGDRLPGEDVDEHVEPLLLLLDAREERRDLRVDRVIDADRDADAARRRSPAPPSPRWFRAGRRSDGRGVRLAAAAAARAVDGGAGFAEHPRDAAPGTASGAGDDGDVSFERFHGGPPCSRAGDYK